MMNWDVPFRTRKCNYGQGHMTTSLLEKDRFVHFFQATRLNISPSMQTFATFSYCVVRTYYSGTAVDF